MSRARNRASSARTGPMITKPFMPLRPAYSPSRAVELEIMVNLYQAETFKEEEGSRSRFKILWVRCWEGLLIGTAISCRAARKKWPVEKKKKRGLSRRIQGMGQDPKCSAATAAPLASRPRTTARGSVSSDESVKTGRTTSRRRRMLTHPS